MAVETFTWRTLTEPTGTVSYRVKTAQFGDGYSQAVGDGINNKVQSWQLEFAGIDKEVFSICEFLDKHMGYKSFLWTPPGGEPGYYRAQEGYQIVPHGNMTWSLSVVFMEVFQP